jgi:hypothetical protein
MIAKAEGVDGPRRRPDDDEVPARRAARRRCGARRRGLPGAAGRPPEAIWDLHHELVTREGADKRTRELLREAARIATVDMSDVSVEVRRLDALWSEQELLDPAAAADTLSALAVEVDRVEPQLIRLRARQDVIARELARRAKELDG